MRGPCAAVRGAPGHPARLSGRGTFVIEKRIGIIMHGVEGNCGAGVTPPSFVRPVTPCRCLMRTLP